MVIIDTVINTLLGGLTLDPAGMHCPARDDAFVSSYVFVLSPAPTYPTLMARYSLFVLKVPLNPKQTNKQTLSLLFA